MTREQSEEASSPFSEMERRAWFEDKRARERQDQPIYRSASVAVCVHCQIPFGINEGVVTGQVALCSACLGD